MEHSLIYGFLKRIGLFIQENYEKSKLNAISNYLSKKKLIIRENSIFISQVFKEKTYIENSIFFSLYKLILKLINKLLKTLNSLIRKYIGDSLFYLSGKDLSQEFKGNRTIDVFSIALRESIPYRLVSTIFTLEEAKKIGK